MTGKLDPEETVSTMVALDTIKLCFVAMELMKLDCLAGDINSAYIQAYTKEKVYTYAGPEFGRQEGSLFLVNKALHGLQASGNAWHTKFADDLYDMGFTQSKADPDLWIKPMGDHYKMIGVFVDDVTVFSRNPQAIFNTLTNKYKYEFKAIEKPEYFW